MHLFSGFIIIPLESLGAFECPEREEVCSIKLIGRGNAHVSGFSSRNILIWLENQTNIYLIKVGLDKIKVNWGIVAPFHP